MNFVPITDRCTDCNNLLKGEYGYYRLKWVNNYNKCGMCKKPMCLKCICNHPFGHTHCERCTKQILGD